MREVIVSSVPLILERNVMVEMRDGVRLATDVYRPAGATEGQTFPVVLERTPYGKHRDSRTEREPGSRGPQTREAVAARFVAQGYVVVYQDCRGRYNSEGRFTKYLDEANDGHDTCEWIVAQPWCNGRIGTMGLSYAAHTQMALASVGAPGLKAMFVDSGGFSNGYRSGIRQGGAYELKQANWAILYATKAAKRDGKTEPERSVALEDIGAWFKKMPWRRGNSPLSATPEYEDFLFDQWERGTFDDDWKQPGIYGEGFYHRHLDVAGVHMSSWYDVYSRTAVENFQGLRQAGAAAARLILGPWTHGNRWETFAGDVDFGPQATFGGNVAESLVDARLAWFNAFLKDDRQAAQSWPDVQIFVMGGGSGRKNAEGRLDHGGEWRAETEWPLVRTAWRTMYMRGDGGLGPAAPASAFAFTYEFDPRHPVPTIGGSVVTRPPGVLAGGFDQRTDARFFGCEGPSLPLAARQDVLVFQTAALEQDTEVTGPIVAHLWISSDCVDTDFTIKLIDVYPASVDYPEGFALNLTVGILRVRYRDSWEQPVLMQPGVVYPIKVEAFPTSNLFKAGHRVRVDVSSSNFPHFDVNPNTGEPEAQATAVRVARNTLHVGPQHPSHIVLPVIERTCA